MDRKLVSLIVDGVDKTDENKLNITTIYGKKSPAVNQPDSDFIVPHEIILSGTVDGPEYGLTDLPSDELIVINSISLTKLNPESYHDIEFKPPIGLGCPSLVEETKLFPQLFNSQQLSFKSIETSSKSSEEQNKINIEIYANWDKIITIINPIINDQNVNHNQSTCSVSTINSDDYLNQVNQLFWIKDDLKYRGQFPSFQGELETWESTNYEETINGIKYDRVNIIHMLQKVNSTINLTNYILINSTRTIYNEVYLGQYDLIESQTRQVLKFDTITTINQTMEQLTVNCKH
ncbi:uncharacterized protein LOC128385560 [Panonychus citri]|uniref:uncharacterized protein LOC128385560 n=1 Tax=Panonychus citri TaxID=50023 RepID=UPI0023077B76|nr:uncharacterized protein LOC128385560 [Panonychus citri]